MLSPKYSTIFISSIILDLVTTQEISLGVNTLINETNRMMPTKTNTFIELISRGTFIDKSLLIDSIMRTLVSVSVITCPRKWGKSVNLDMLRTYLALQVHPNGTKISPVYYQLFTEGRYHSEHHDIVLETPLLISDKKYNYLKDRYLGQFPVIYISFSEMPPTDGNNYNTVVGRIIAEVFDHHKYLLKVYDTVIGNPKGSKKMKKLAESKKKKFTMYLDDQIDNDEMLHESICFLGQELYEHFDKRVFILVDDFDKNPFTEASELIRSILCKAFEPNEYLEQGIITGVLPIEWGAKIADLFPFLHSRYDLYYGFTKNEMNLIYAYYKIPVEEQAKIRYWYNGYEIPVDNSQRLYNPSSICEYVNVRHFQLYWNDVHFHDDYLNEILDLPEYLYLLSRLIIGDTYSTSFTDPLSRMLKNDDLDFSNTNSDKNRFTRYLVASGYLTLKNFTHKTNPIHAAIPNYEVSLHLQDLLAVKMSQLMKRHLFDLLTETSRVWERYLIRISTSSGELETRMRQCFRSLATFGSKQLHPIPYDRQTFVSHLLMSIVPSAEFNFVTFAADEEPPKNQSGQVVQPPDIIMSANDTGFVIYLNYEQNDTSVYSTHQYSDILKRYTALLDWKDIRVITCTVKPNQDVTINSIMNPLDASKRQHVSPKRKYRFVESDVQGLNSSERRYKETLHNYLTQLGLA